MKNRKYAQSIRTEQVASSVIVLLSAKYFICRMSLSIFHIFGKSQSGSKLKEEQRKTVSLKW